jgi:hypothetical protein
MEQVQSAVGTAPVHEPLIEKELARKKILFKQISNPVATQSITFWEELTCVGYLFIFFTLFPDVETDRKFFLLK